MILGSNIVKVTEIPQEQNKVWMNELLLKLIELVGALEEIFRQIDIADRLTNARNGIRSSADKTFIVARI